MSKHRVACVGEAMIELNIDNPGRQIGFAGDTLNTAIYLARSAGDAAEVEFVSRIGRDAMSDRMAQFIRSEGVGTSQLVRHPDRLPGVYAIAVDAQGERSFSYWRNQSAARTLFEDGFAQLDGFDTIYLSGITLAILPPEVRRSLLAHLAAHPAQIVFDSNYRPRLWESPEVARATTEAAWRVADIGLPSIDDEMALFGDTDEAAALTRLRSYGLTRGALKRGAKGPLPLNPTVSTTHPYPGAPTVVDTTAAGDSFNGAYLAALITGKTEEAALRAGHDMAIRVIGQPGAIIPLG